MITGIVYIYINIYIIRNINTLCITLLRARKESFQEKRSSTATGITKKKRKSESPLLFRNGGDWDWSQPQRNPCRYDRMLGV